MQISRPLLRAVRGVFRRARIGPSASGPPNQVFIQSGADGLRIRGLSPHVAIEYHEPGRRHVEQFVLPVPFLDDCEGRQDEPVELEVAGPDQAAGSDQALARFSDGGVPQLLSYRLGQKAGFDGFPEWPHESSRVATNGPRLLTALRTTLPMTDRDPGRYALSCLQLRGAGAQDSSGRIAATDGRQILLQSGFQFPWQGDVLVPADAVLKSPEFLMDQAVEVGRLEPWVLLRMGRWTVGLRIQDGRFPRVDDVIPKAASISTRLQLADDDARFLLQAIPKLPSNDETNQPVTVDLNGRVVVRSKNASSPATELILSRSRCDGEPLTLVTNRKFLQRAVELGFRELRFAGPEQPALCDDGRQTFVWALLEKDAAVKADKRAIAVDSAAAPTSAPDSNKNARQPTSQPQRSIPMPKRSHGDARPEPHSSTAASAAPASGSPIEEAETLRTLLRNALARTNSLVASLRRQRKQQRLVRSTLDSLKELERSAG